MFIEYHDETQEDTVLESIDFWVISTLNSYDKIFSKICFKCKIVVIQSNY